MRFLAILCLALLLPQLAPAASMEKPIPAWVEQMIADQDHAGHPDIIEESLYSGKRAFEVTHTKMADTGDEHVLLDEEGKQVCIFRGIAGRVLGGDPGSEALKDDRIQANGRAAAIPCGADEP